VRRGPLSPPAAHSILLVCWPLCSTGALHRVCQYSPDLRSSWPWFSWDRSVSHRRRITLVFTILEVRTCSLTGESVEWSSACVPSVGDGGQIDRGWQGSGQKVLCGHQQPIGAGGGQAGAPAETPDPASSMLQNHECDVRITGKVENCRPAGGARSRTLWPLQKYGVSISVATGEPWPGRLWWTKPT